MKQIKNTNEVNKMNKTKMQKEFKKTISALYDLKEAWNEDEVKNYPQYMPSFDEFIDDFIKTIKY